MQLDTDTVSFDTGTMGQGSFYLEFSKQRERISMDLSNNVFTY